MNESQIIGRYFVKAIISQLKTRLKYFVKVIISHLETRRKYFVKVIISHLETRGTDTVRFRNTVRFQNVTLPKLHVLVCEPGLRVIVIP